MKKLICSVALFICSTSAFAQWQDVNYSAVVKKDYIYCDSQGKLDDFGAFAQDGDEDGANKMVSDGKCHVSKGLKVSVFQENEYAVCFLAPSGKAFYTYKAFIKR